MAEGGASEPRRRAQQQGSGGQSGEIPKQSIGADQHSPAREACLLTRRGGWGLGTQPEGGSAPQLARRESGKRSGAAEEARDFFLPLCFLVGEERGLRAPLKGAPETGESHGRENARRASGWCNVTPASTATGSPQTPYPSLPPA